MKYSAIVAGMLAATGFSQQFVSDANVHRTPLESNIHKTRLGAIVEENVYEDIVEKIVTFSSKTPDIEMALRADLLHGLSDNIQSMDEDVYSAEHAPVYKCDERFYNNADATDAFAFSPVLMAQPTEENPTATYEGQCYNKIDITFSKTSETSFDILLNLQDKKSLFCKDAILFGNSNLRHFEIFFRPGQHKITFNMDSELVQADVGHNGISMFLVCESIVHEVESILRTVEMFIGGMSLNPDPSKPINSSYVPEYMEEANLRFLRTAMNYTMTKRETTKVVIDPSTINSGDFFPVIRMDGLAPIIMYGSGSFASHCTMALWFDDELYIVESTDGWYWPVGGLQRTPFAQWMDQAEKASYYVSHLPLNGEARAKFDEEAAQEFFFGAEGLPYGYHNFIYGWVDTPRDNLPPGLPAELVPLVFAWLETFDRKMTDSIMTEGLNMRFGTKNLSLPEITQVAAEQDMSILDAYAMIEVQGWEYSDGRSFVCSAFVTALYKAAGLFDDYDINATEFTPRDVYQLAFFDETTPLPQQCIDADADLPFCQLLGNYRMYLPHYNTITPYEHMNEHCTTIVPDYVRPEGC